MQRILQEEILVDYRLDGRAKRLIVTCGSAVLQNRNYTVPHNSLNSGFAFQPTNASEKFS
jgi:hypothetical protein